MMEDRHEADCNADQNGNCLDFAVATDRLRSDAEPAGFVLACLDHLHPCRIGNQHVVDVATDPPEAGAPSRLTTFDRAEFMGLVHL